MFKRQETDFSTTKSNNPKEFSLITAVIVGCLIGLILSFMIYTYVPKPGFIDRFLVWWFSDCHSLPPPPLSTEGQERIPTTNLPTQNTNNHSRVDDDGIQNLPVDNNNLNNNDIELTDLNTSIAPLPPPNTTTTTR